MVSRFAESFLLLSLLSSTTLITPENSYAAAPKGSLVTSKKVPLTLGIDIVKKNSVFLNWDGAAGNNVKLYRNGLDLGVNPKSTFATDSGNSALGIPALNPGQHVQYSVATIDAKGRILEQSDPVQVIMPHLAPPICNPNNTLPPVPHINVAAIPLAEDEGFHGVSVRYRTAQFTEAGHTSKVDIVLNGIDGLLDQFMVTSAFVTAHHFRGDMRSINLLANPIIIDSAFASLNHANSKLVIPYDLPAFPDDIFLDSGRLEIEIWVEGYDLFNGPSDLIRPALLACPQIMNGSTTVFSGLPTTF